MNNITLETDWRRAYLPEGEYPVLITGNSPLYYEDKYDDLGRPYTVSHVDYYFTVIGGKYQHAFENVYRFANCTSMYITNTKVASAGNGGCSDMTRVRLKALTDSYHNFHRAMVKDYEERGIDAPPYWTDALGEPYDPDFDAQTLFEEGKCDQIAGRTGAKIVTKCKKLKGRSEVAVPYRVEPLDLYAYINNIPNGYIKHFGDGASEFHVTDETPELKHEWVEEYKRNVGQPVFQNGFEPYTPELVAALYPKTGILVDACQKEGHHDVKHDVMKKNGFDLFFGNRLNVGDYMNPRLRLSVDTKASFEELCSNLSDSDIGRFKAELQRAEDADVDLYIIVDMNGRCPEDPKNLIDILKSINSPECKGCSYGTCSGLCKVKPGHQAPITGEEAVKRLDDIAKRYENTHFVFVNDEKEQAEYMCKLFLLTKETTRPEKILYEA